jgi:hypothetical protein
MGKMKREAYKARFGSKPWLALEKHMGIGIMDYRIG